MIKTTGFLAPSQVENSRRISEGEFFYPISAALVWQIRELTKDDLDHGL